MSTSDLPATTSTDVPQRMLEEDFGIALMDGEKVLVEGDPMRGKLMRYFMVLSVFVTLLTGVGLLALPIIYFVMRAWVNKHRYWVTNTRVVVTNGIIGFKARSIPLERVSDVAISCNFIERAMGLRSVVVRDMTGEALSGASMLAAPNASALQQRILDQVHSVNRSGERQEGERLQGRPYREIEGEVQETQMLDLLRRIEQNTRTEK